VFLLAKINQEKRMKK